MYTAAAVASGLAAFNVSALGVTATGFGVIGLILVAVGVLVGFVILVIKDKPPEAWAVKTVWGTAEQKWADFAAEEREANKVLLCAQIDFSFRWNVIENLGTSAMAADGAGFSGRSRLILGKLGCALFGRKRCANGWAGRCVSTLRVQMVRSW